MVKRVNVLAFQQKGLVYLVMANKALSFHFKGLERPKGSSSKDASHSKRRHLLFTSLMLVDWYITLHKKELRLHRLV